MLTEQEPAPTRDPANDVTSTPAPVIRHAPPPGRPPGTLSISELRERIAVDVSRMTMAEQARRSETLRAELLEEVRTAKSLGLMALVINVASIAALAGLARGRLGLLAGVGIAAVEFLVVSVVWTVARRRPHSLSLIRLP